MTEQTAQPLQEFAVNVSYTITVGHVGKLAAAADLLGVNKSEAIRKAIDLLFAQTFPAPTTPHTTE